MKTQGAILLMGIPGAGKGTQAFRLMQHFPNFVHFDTGGEIYRRITDPAFANDSTVQEQKEIYFAGKLNTPAWVSKLVAERIRHYAREGHGVILSGSPRTVTEAQAIAPLLSKVYGRRRILIMVLRVSEEEARQRSLKRVTCTNKACRYPTTPDHAGQPCPKCSQVIPQMADQKGEEWKISRLETRFAEFRERTLPALEFLRQRFSTADIDGERSEEEVFAQILSAVEKNLIPPSSDS